MVEKAFLMSRQTMASSPVACSRNMVGANEWVNAPPRIPAPNWTEAKWISASLVAWRAAWAFQHLAAVEVMEMGLTSTDLRFFATGMSSATDSSA
jgi:hypothetical protein